jgi:hypothetical protein
MAASRAFEPESLTSLPIGAFPKESTLSITSNTDLNGASLVIKSSFIPFFPLKWVIFPLITGLDPPPTA